MHTFGFHEHSRAKADLGPTGGIEALAKAKLTADYACKSGFEGKPGL